MSMQSAMYWIHFLWAGTPVLFFDNNKIFAFFLGSLILIWLIALPRPQRWAGWIFGFFTGYLFFSHHLSLEWIPYLIGFTWILPPSSPFLTMYLYILQPLLSALAHVFRHIYERINNRGILVLHVIQLLILFSFQFLVLYRFHTPDFLIQVLVNVLVLFLAGLTLLEIFAEIEVEYPVFLQSLFTIWTGAGLFFMKGDIVILLKGWSLLVGVLGLLRYQRIILTGSSWQRGLAWLVVFSGCLVPAWMGIWMYEIQWRELCPAKERFVRSESIHAYHMFPVSAIPDTQWNPVTPHFVKITDGCWRTSYLDGQFITFVWKIRRLVECPGPLMWKVWVTDLENGERLFIQEYNACIWPTTEAVLFPQTFVLPGKGTFQRFKQRLIAVCESTPQWKDPSFLDTMLIEVQRTPPLLFIQNVAINRVGERDFVMSIRLYNNRHSVVEGTLLVGLIRPTNKPPFRWINVQKTHVVLGSGDSDGWKIELHPRPWCGEATWGVAFYETSGVKGYLWDAL